MVDLLARPLTLPCGAELSNRLAKSAMTEGLADAHNHATAAHETLYGLWAGGGAGLLITGNVMVDREVLERPGNVILTDDSGHQALKRWARAGTAGGNHLWMQLSHAGRQSPRYVTRQPVAPSAVQLKMGASYAEPRALEGDEIRAIIERFAAAATMAEQAGFTGVQIHAAHGYLISSFLSPVTNRRTDDWGGSLRNRARLLLDTIAAVRQSTGARFALSVKLNSADFQRGGFTNEECLQVVAWLNDAGVDLLEISGGTYEQPRLLGFEGQRSSASEPLAESTRRREAYFLEYARAVRKVARMPLMLTGGFRSRAVMEAALRDGDVDVIGLARPMCVQTDLPAQLLRGEIDQAPCYEAQMRLGPGWLSASSPIYLLKLINIMGQQGWFYMQLLRLGHGLPANLKLGVLGGLIGHMRNELRTASAMKKARRQGTD